jgi:hypothetical protein
MLEVGICSSLYSPKLVQSCSDLVTVLVREDAEVHHHALQTMTEQFQLLLFRNNVWIMGHTLLSNLPTYSLAVIRP